MKYPTGDSKKTTGNSGLELHGEVRTRVINFSVLKVNITEVKGTDEALGETTVRKQWARSQVFKNFSTEWVARYG